MKSVISRIFFAAFINTIFASAIVIPENTSKKEIPTLYAGISEFPGFVYHDSNGLWNGVDVEYLYNIAQHNGFRIEFRSSEKTQDMLDWLDSGRIDVAIDMIKTPARETKYIFSEHEEGIAGSSVVVRRDDDRWLYGDIIQLSYMKIAAEKNNAITKLFREMCTRNNISPQIIEYDSQTDKRKALLSGAADGALVGVSYEEGTQAILKFGATQYYFMFRSADTALKNRFDQAMEEITSNNPQYYQTLVEKYTSAFNTMKTEAFSSHEKQYIATHPVQKIAVLTHDEPYFSRSEAGIEEGILPEFYKQITLHTGILFTFTAYTTQEKAIDAVKNGEADILGIYSNGLTSAVTEGLQTTRNYSTTGVSMVTRTGTDPAAIHTSAVKQWNENTLQLRTGSEMDGKFITYGTTVKCFNALRKREVDAVICDIPSATWLVNQVSVSSYNISPLDSFSLDLCGAVAYGNTVLCSILDKAIFASDYTMNGIIANNTLQKKSWLTFFMRLPPVLLTIIIAVMLLFICCLAITLLMLAKRQKERSAVLAVKAQNARRELELSTLEKNTEARNQFFSNISHDMRTPLNGIIGFAGLLEKEPLSKKALDYISKIKLSGTLLLDLINDTLTISKISSGKLQLHPEPVAVDDIFNSVIVSVKEAAVQKHIKFTAEQTGLTQTTIMADPLNIEKIMLNLLTNAVKYTPNGGSVDFLVKAGKKDSGHIVVEIVVKDTGIGISADFLPHIYEPFLQEHRSGYESSGTGLGLSIVKQLVDLMGGTIEVQSTVNQGTVFTVCLTFTVVKASEIISAAPKVADTATDLAGKKVLLCEDNKLNREIACALLQEKGMTVDIAENGQKGIELFSKSQENTYSVILMDIRMPVMDGYQACKVIRSLDRKDAKTVPILAMTADAFEDDKQKALNAGMNDHIAKPISPEKLYDTLLHFISKK